MILGAEIAIAVLGLYTLVTGKYPMGKGRTLIGGKARILGVLCLLPIPLAFMMGLLMGIAFLAISGEAAPALVLGIMEILIIVVVAVIVSILGKKFYDVQEQEKVSEY